tara:strand:+ start:313 stop:765 length:453 start_codon:yes stop_codon:yes gene_type:complete
MKKQDKFFIHPNLGKIHGYDNLESFELDMKKWNIKQNEEMKNKEMKKIHLGRVAVDSGQLMITDPCYIKDFKDNEFTSEYKDKLDTSYSYNGSCSLTCYTKEMGGELGNGLGISFASGLGDGSYSVFAYIKDLEGWGRRVHKIEIVLIDE